VNIGIVLDVPPEVVTLDGTGGGAEDGLAENGLATDEPAAGDAASLLGGVARTKADAGNPPKVWASAAFMA
jgi:hypothetical protein